MSVPAATRSPHVSRATRRQGAEAKVRPGWGGEAIRSRSRASALQATVATASAGTLGASLGALPRPAAPVPFQELGVSFLFKRTSRLLVPHRKAVRDSS